MTATLLETIQTLQRQAASLLLYASVLETDAGQAFVSLLDAIALTLHSETKQPECDRTCLQAYSRWFRCLAGQNASWQTMLLQATLQDENPFSLQAQQRRLATLPASLVTAAQHDLQILQQLHAITSQQLSHWVQQATQLPAAPVAWELEVTDSEDAAHTLGFSPSWPEALPALVQHYRQQGTGVFASYSALRWHQGKLVGIPHPDPVQMADLAGYADQQQLLAQNTEALLAGYPALNVLLYGSRGSGKSSLIKAMRSRYCDRGLRLIEVAKSDLGDLSTIVEQLRGLPQCFIIFVDDLSFEDDDATYKALKVVLEGTLTPRPPNVVVYATSNRRHLIREFFGDRPRPRDQDEIHAWDTVQEKLSFCDRFGLTLTFEPADQPTYLTIVRHLAEQAQIPLEPSELEARSLQWATRHNGRSGRTARQFIDFLRAELQLPS